MLANNAKINWLPEHIRDGRFGNFLETTSIGPCPASATGARRCRSGSAKTTGTCEAVASYDELLAKPGVAGTEVWERPSGRIPQLSDHLKVHKPYIDAVTYAGPQRRADAARARGDRLLVRFRRHAVRPMGLSAPSQREVPPAVPGRLHQRGDRPDPRLVLQPAGHQHDVVRRAGAGAGESSELGTRNSEPEADAKTSSQPQGLPPMPVAPFRPSIRIRSAIASCWG